MWVEKGINGTYGCFCNGTCVNGRLPFPFVQAGEEEGSQNILVKGKEFWKEWNWFVAFVVTPWHKVVGKEFWVAVGHNILFMVFMKNVDSVVDSITGFSNDLHHRHAGKNVGEWECVERAV